jgi:nucleotide-binding universal stress UspA family protein
MAPSPSPAGLCGGPGAGARLRWINVPACEASYRAPIVSRSPFRRAEDIMRGRDAMTTNVIAILGLKKPTSSSPGKQALDMFKDLMLHLDGTGEDEIRLAHAEAIATRFGAHMTGLYANPLPDYMIAFGGEPSFTAMSAVVEMEQRARAEGDLVLARLEARFQRLAAPHEIRRIAAQRIDIPGLAASQARWADLFVASAPYRNSDAYVGDRLLESVLFEGGRAVYAIPPGAKPREETRSILIAWRDTRESARAVAEALPFLRRAAKTRLVTVDAQGGRVEPAMDVAAHLDRHGVDVEIMAVEAGNRTVAQILIEEAHKLSADLIVMGAYGHSRFREWILGGATREMLETSDVPIFMAH